MQKKTFKKKPKNQKTKPPEKSWNAFLAVDPPEHAAKSFCEAWFFGFWVFSCFFDKRDIEGRSQKPKNQKAKPPEKSWTAFLAVDPPEHAANSFCEAWFFGFFVFS